MLRLVASGRRNADIAACLNIAQKTVEGYVSDIRKKLAASSRVDLANQARVLGLL